MLKFSRLIPEDCFTKRYDLLDLTESRYQSKIKFYFPNAAAVQDYVNAQGINGFYENVENRKSCCEIKKVEPLNRALKGTFGMDYRHSLPAI